MIMARLLAATSIACLLAAGCTTLDQPLAGSMDGAFADNNFSAQVVDPTPAPGAPVMDAAMANAAIDRYHKGKVKTGEAEETPIVTVNLPPAS
jgi:hypothetical protein